MAKTQLSSQLCHHVLMKMCSLISDNGLRDAKMGYNMFKEELSSSDIVSIICGHHLGPFSKIVDDDDDIAMSPGRARVTCHEIYAPFSKWSNGNDWV